MVDQDTIVCRFDGIPVTTSKSGHLIHLDEIPAGVPDHAVVMTSNAEYEAVAQALGDFKVVAAELLEHHSNFHPLSECAWAHRLTAVLRTSLT